MMDARGWPIRASLALALVLIPLNFPDFTAKAADFVKTDSSHGTTMWVDREVKDFTLNPEWKIVRVIVRLHDGSESRQTYIVDFTHNRSTLVEENDQPVPVGEWTWKPGVPERFSQGRSCSSLF